ncbi:MAG: MGMT family protein [Pseudomonadota bacterium]
MGTKTPHQVVFELIAMIPNGYVASYAQIARFAGLSNPRQVGQLLKKEGFDGEIPWHRVVRADGMIAERPGQAPAVQYRRLLAEGVAISNAGRVDMASHQWAGPDPDWRLAHGSDPEDVFTA